MHQQIRTRVGATSTTDGVGAMESEPVEGGEIVTDRNTLDELLELVAGAGYDICLAGGRGLAGTGEFVFAIEHAEGELQTQECAAMLSAAGFREVKVRAPAVRWLDDRPGSLRDALRDIAKNGGKPHELFVGKTRDGRAFIHVTTIR